MSGHRRAMKLLKKTVWIVVEESETAGKGETGGDGEDGLIVANAGEAATAVLGFSLLEAETCNVHDVHSLSFDIDIIFQFYQLPLL